MKSAILIITLLVGLICSYLYLETQASKKAVILGYQNPVIEAPTNVAEYPPTGAIHHGDGLYSQILKHPSQAAPPLRRKDILQVFYTGWQASSGRMFDSSISSGKTFPLRTDSTSVIEGWQRIIPELREGEVRRVWIPQELAYKDTKNLNISAQLVFDIEIRSVKYSPSAPDFYAKPSTPEENAKLYPSGLICQTTKNAEKNATSATAQDIVTVHLTKWTTDGVLISSTKLDQHIVQLDLSRCIPAYRKAISTMQVGESMRCWVPAKLSYNENFPRSQPQGNFICDIELLSITKQPQ